MHCPKAGKKDEGCSEGDDRCVGALAIRLLASEPDSLKGDEMTVGKGAELRM